MSCCSQAWCWSVFPERRRARPAMPTSSRAPRRWRRRTKTPRRSRCTARPSSTRAPPTLRSASARRSRRSETLPSRRSTTASRWRERPSSPMRRPSRSRSARCSARRAGKGKGLVQIFAARASRISVNGKQFPTGPVAMFAVPGEYEVEAVFPSGKKTTRLRVKSGQVATINFEPVQPPLLSAEQALPEAAIASGQTSDQGLPRERAPHRVDHRDGRGRGGRRVVARCSASCPATTQRRLATRSSAVPSGRPSLTPRMRGAPGEHAHDRWRGRGRRRWRDVLLLAARARQEVAVGAGGSASASLPRLASGSPGGRVRIVLVLRLCLSSLVFAAAPKRISLEVTNADIHSVLRLFSRLDVSTSSSVKRSPGR